MATDFATWKTYHATLFHLTGADDLAMIDLWIEIFEREQLTAEELTEASEFIAKAGEVRWRTDHLKALSDRVHERRFTEQRHREMQAEQRTVIRCEHCGNTGQVAVPHLKSVKDGAWVYPWYSAVCHCSCERGAAAIRYNERLRSAETPKERGGLKFAPPKVLTLDEYRAINPDFKAQMRQRAEMVEQLAKVKMATTFADASRGPIKEPKTPAGREVAAQVATPKAKPEPRPIDKTVEGIIARMKARLK